MKRRRNLLLWAGFAVVLAAFGTYIPVFARYASTRDIPWANYLLFLLGGALLFAGVKRAFRDPEHYRGKISGSILSALSALLLALFILTITWFSRQIPSADAALKPGRQAPPFVLTDAAGKPVSSADLLKDHRAMVLVFYRGYW